MSASGVFAVSRGIFEHTAFADEAFTEREAWIWMIGEAAWKARRVRVGSAVLEIERRQLALSTRFAAARWQWSEARVRRFLKRLISSQMIETETDAHATRITICNYDEYQKVSMPTDAVATHTRRTDDAPPTQQRRKTEDRENRKDSLPSVESGAAAPPKRPKARKGTRLPPDWTPSEPTIAYAESQGFSRPETLRIAEKFRNYWHSTPKNAVKLDWHATWRNWVLTEAERAGKAPRAPPPTADPGAWPLSFAEDVCRRAFLDDRWLIGMGPEPGYGGCKVPRDVQDRWMAERAERKGRAA